MGLVCAQGGSEAKHSNELLHRIISEAVEAVAPEVGPGLVSLINTRDEIRDLLKLDDVIDLVRALMSSTRTPAPVALPSPTNDIQQKEGMMHETPLGWLSRCQSSSLLSFKNTLPMAFEKHLSDSAWAESMPACQHHQERYSCLLLDAYTHSAARG